MAKYDTLSWLQNLTFSSLVKTGKKAQLSLDPESSQFSGIAFFPPSDESRLQLWTGPVLDWLEQHPHSNVRIYSRPEHLDELISIFPNARIVPLLAETIRKNGLPKTMLKKKMLIQPSAISVLLARDFDPLMDAVFALLPSRLKISFYHSNRDEYASFMVSPHAGLKDLSHSLRTLFEYVDKFQTGGVALRESTYQ